MATITLVYNDMELLLERDESNMGRVEEDLLSDTFGLVKGSIRAFHSVSQASNSSPLFIPCENIVEGGKKTYIIEDSISTRVFVCGDPNSVVHGKKKEHDFIDLTENIRSDRDVNCSPEFCMRMPTSNTLASDKQKNVLDLVSKLPVKSKLRTLVDQISIVTMVTELPSRYDGDCIFELPPVDEHQSSMSGMEQSADGHPWVRYATSTIMNFEGDVRISSCGGAFVCDNNFCGHRTTSGKANITQWRGRLSAQCTSGKVEKKHGGFCCFHCGEKPTFVRSCGAKIYYVIPEDIRYTRLVIHVGKHTHLVADGHSRHRSDIVRSLVQEQIEKIPGAGQKKLEKEVAREIIMKNLIPGDPSQIAMLTPEKFEDLLDQIQPLTNQRRLRKWIDEYKTENRPKPDSIDSILSLKEKCQYEYFHGSLFPGQVVDGLDDRCFVFKMSTIGPASGVDLVRRMQKGNDLAQSWICFDHVHRVRDWSTMAAHVYDPSLQSLQTIAVCEMKVEDAIAQTKYWNMLNAVMKKHGIDTVQFKGFMADEAGANWNAVRKVYGDGEAFQMEGRERTCLFHFKDSLRKHTKQCIFQEFRNEHISLCDSWRLAENVTDANIKYNVVKSFWRSGAAYVAQIPALEAWLSWWHMRYSHWGRYMKSVIDDNEKALMPTVNLSESRHGSWLAAEGYRSQISLYEACVGDMVNAILQSTKYSSYVKGRHIGMGPNLEKLLGRVSSSRSSAIQGTSFVNLVRDVADHASLSSISSSLGGNDQSVPRKRPISQWTHDKPNVSHRPDMEYVNVPRVPTPLGNVPHQQRHVKSHMQMVGAILEREVHKTMWAIRRIPAGSKIICMGQVDGRKKCGVVVSFGNDRETVVAPSFFGIRRHNKGETMQFMWFCFGDVTHTWHPNKNIVAPPSRIDGEWCVAVGTSLCQDEVDILNKGGYVLECGVTPNQALDIRNTCASPTMQPEEIGVSMQRSRTRRRNSISHLANERIKKALCLKANMVKEEVHIMDRDVSFHVHSFASNPEGKNYIVKICDSPACTCEDFRRITAKGKFTPCKHMYFVYIVVLGLDIDNNMCIHQPNLSLVELFQVLSRKRNVSSIL